ncbi:MAG: bifunctional precorrin-2 dehydrogenase/sirohydrochlorin ferrochelatase, partial [Nitrospirales bacterium]
EFGQFLDWLGSLREELQKNEPKETKRRERLREAVEGFGLTGKVTYPASWIAHKEQSASS